MDLTHRRDLGLQLRLMSRGGLCVRARRLLQQTCRSLRSLSKGWHNKQNKTSNLVAFKYPTQEPKEVSKGPHQEHGPDCACLLTVNFRQPRVLVIHWFRL
jgi:hypothetical protein